MREALWFSRVIRLFGAKELFDVVINVFNWLLRYRSGVVLDAERRSIPHRELFWACLSMIIGIALLRYATEISVALVGRRGPRRISGSLSAGGNAWLSLGVRFMAFYLLVHSVWYFVNGFFASINEARLTEELLSRTSFHYFVWALVYAGVGTAFSARPDIIGIFLPSGRTPEKRKDGTSQSPEPTPPGVAGR
jgi:hypothetical protein